MNPAVQITNPDGKFAVYEITGSSVMEIERYNTQAEAVDAVGKLLGSSAVTLSVMDLAGRSEVYSIAWPGAAAEPAPVAAAAPVAEEAPAEKVSAK